MRKFVKVITALNIPIVRSATYYIPPNMTVRASWHNKVTTRTRRGYFTVAVGKPQKQCEAGAC